MTVRVVEGDALERLRELPNNSFDGLLCDPPYGFSFMGHAWDYDVPSVDVWREALRVLKPGAPLLAFGGARTFHRICVGIEDAGFELRDVLHWLYGKGFPKSLDISKALDKAAGAERPVVGTRVLTGNAAVSTQDKGGTFGVQVGTVPPKTVNVTGPATDIARQWDGYGTALKPAYEPIVLARKPLDGTVAANVARWGVGGLAIDACRIGDSGGAAKAHPQKHKAKNCYGNGLNGGGSVSIDAGRWPANLLLDEDAAAALDAESGGIKPSRFYYCSKVSTREREAGCEHLPQRSAAEMTLRSDSDAPGTKHARAGAGGSTGGARNHHPTLKPIPLTTWLARLIMPPTPDATLLVPYSGAGSEIIGALRAGWPNVVAVERSHEYVQIAHARLAHWTKEIA